MCTIPTNAVGVEIESVKKALAEAPSAGSFSRIFRKSLHRRCHHRKMDIERQIMTAITTSLIGEQSISGKSRRAGRDRFAGDTLGKATLRW